LLNNLLNDNLGRFSIQLEPGESALSNFFFNILWPGLTVWSVLFISDYVLTITCARLYRAGVSKKLVVEGSYEITPYFQRDIDSLRLVSPRFLAALLLGAIMLTAVWLLAGQSLPGLCNFALGSKILVQLTVHTRLLPRMSQP
jgi:hypothetical protein